MSRYLLDNGVLVAYLKGRPGALRLIRPWIVNREVVTSVIVYGEAVEYMRGDTNFRQRRDELRALLREVIPLTPTYAILERYADLRRELRRSGGLIGDIDTLIAATALDHNLTIVTLDSDFQRVPGLAVMRMSRAELMA
ncbi:MAG TPA: type II toxin-antitoxin system VapC family toxin [Ktedonobacterales bacterium]|jgi:tRNA(fMet)-specific endonuclease VapC